MANKMTRLQHYVPQFYLRNFTDDNKIFWFYNRLKETVHMSTPKDICREIYLYESETENPNGKIGKYVLPNSIEKSFSNYEREYAKVLKRIFEVCENPDNINALICNSFEKDILASFVANMILRNPWSLRKCLQQTSFDGISGNEECESISKVLEVLEFGEFKALYDAAQKRVILDEQFNEGLPYNFKKEIINMNLSVLKTEKINFITSDFPVIVRTYDDEEGSIKPLYIYFPISSKYALLYSKKNENRTSRNRIVVLNNETTKKINNIYFKQDKKISSFIIAKEKMSLKVH